MKTKILIATHKTCNSPDNIIYQPIQVGKALSNEDFGYLCDDTGENISEKNKNYSELTALYWAWKNNYFTDAEYCGLVHYRRYFVGSEEFENFRILNEDDIASKMKNCDIMLPTKRNYYIETVKSHYVHAHQGRDLEMLQNIIKKKSPEYIKAYKKVMNQRSLHLYNMFIMKSRDFYNYCEWLFPLLFELEKRTDISEYDSYQSRVYGFLSERLFNVWILQNRLKIKELKVVNLEGENLFLKAVGLLKRKYL